MESYLILFGLIYLLTIFTFMIGILRLSPKRNNKIQPISIIVAARNEENNIANLIQSIVEQDYPQDSFELIIANDRSSDETVKIIHNYIKKYPFIKLVNITAENEDLIGKKGAVDAAIRIAKNEILGFTDADCIVRKGWLSAINSHFTDEIDFLAGYSFIDLHNKFATGLKNIERAAIFAVTSGSFGNNWALTCTAGNMAYRKSIYEKIGGFGEIGKIRSGDDDLMLQKMRKKLRLMNFFFNPESIVYTSNKNGLNEHVQRESRRASKWKYYTTPIKIMTLMIFVFYVLLITATFMTVFGKFMLSVLLFIITLKIAFEFVLLAIFLIKIKKPQQLLFFPIAELIYIPYFIFFGLRGTFGKYNWK